jgi:hypothetical protein
VALVENEAVHLQPFLGVLWQPNSRLYTQFFAQLDLDVNGNTTFLAPSAFSDINPEDPQGVYHDQTLLFLDVSVGYWLYRNECARFLTGIIPVVELHYSTTVQDTDFVTSTFSEPGIPGAGNDIIIPPEQLPGVVVSRGGIRTDVLNLTGGVHFNIGRMSTLTVAGVAPLRRGEDSVEALFDTEFVVQFNRRF